MINKENGDTKSGSKSNGDRQEGEQTGILSKAQETAEHVRSATADRVQSARERADAAKRTAAERVRKFGTAFKKVGEHLRVEDQQYIAGRATAASQRIESVADYIESAELSTLLRDAEDVARRQPALVFGGTFLAGLIAGRFLKSGSPTAGSSVTDANARRNRGAVGSTSAAQASGSMNMGGGQTQPGIAGADRSTSQSARDAGIGQSAGAGVSPGVGRAQTSSSATASSPMGPAQGSGGTRGGAKDSESGARR